MKAQQMADESVYFCKCGMAVWFYPKESPGPEVRDLRRRDFREKHSGVGHGPCSYLENRFVGRSVVSTSSSFIDFEGDEWSTPRINDTGRQILTALEKGNNRLDSSRPEGYDEPLHFGGEA